MKLTQAQVNELFKEEELELEGGICLELVEKSSWEQDGKYQSADLIFTNGERFYSSSVSRAGSPFTHWEWDDYGAASVVEVHKVTKTVEVWEAAK